MFQGIFNRNNKQGINSDEQDMPVDENTFEFRKHSSGNVKLSVTSKQIINVLSIANDIIFWVFSGIWY